MQKRFDQEFNKLKLRIFISGFLLLFACIGLSVIWQKSIKEELATQATKLLSRNISASEMREAVGSINGIQTDSFHRITYFGPNGERIISLPPSIEEYKNQSFLHSILYADVRGYLYWDDNQLDRIKGSILFVYPRFGLALYALAVWLFIAIWLTYFLSQSQLRIQNNIEVDFKNQQALFQASLMKKIKHDIRSPLSVLEALIEDKPKDEKWFQEQCLLALKRINEIISESDQYKSGIYLAEQKRQSLFEIKSLAQQIINEKHLLIDNIINCEFDLTPCFTKIDGGKLKATLSNLLDNAIQASEEKSKINLKIDSDDYLTIIKVIDSGKGIPSHILPRLCSEGFTHGKSNGSGLGLYYAKKLVEANGGNIQIESTEGLGTSVTLMIPKIETPSWNFEKIDIHQYKSVIICDDQDYIRDLWKMRLKDLGFSGEISFFKNGEELLANNASNNISLYLIDYDMGPSNISGIELIKRLNNPLNSILVTGHYDDSKIQNLCSEVGCKLLAKDQIARFANPL